MFVISRNIQQENMFNQEKSESKKSIAILTCSRKVG